MINPYYSVEHFIMLEDISIRRGVPIRLLSENVILSMVLIDGKNSDGLTPSSTRGSRSGRPSASHNNKTIFLFYPHLDFSDLRISQSLLWWLTGWFQAPYPFAVLVGSLKFVQGTYVQNFMARSTINTVLETNNRPLYADTRRTFHRWINNNLPSLLFGPSIARFVVVDITHIIIWILWDLWALIISTKLLETDNTSYRRSYPLFVLIKYYYYIIIIIVSYSNQLYEKW